MYDTSDTYHLPLTTNHYYLLPTTYSLLTFRRGARFSKTEDGTQTPLWCAPLASDRLRGLPLPPNHPSGV
ncbi:MAG: hypothetical protein LBK25_06080 [Treponema sp.]|nr:hypothetical protein [Treponema sp.]